MKVVGILSSHYPQSSVQRLMEAYAEALRALGHEFHALDLYQIHFDPVMNGDDFNQFRGGKLPAEVCQIQAEIADAALWVFFFPIWWCDVPAQIKGFLDRILSKGFAYDYDDKVARGLLAVKKVLMISTLGNQRDDFHEKWEHAFIQKYQQGVFQYCGIPEFDARFFYNEGPDSLKRHCEELRALAQN